jgi:hypothetical protein
VKLTDTVPEADEIAVMHRLILRGPILVPRSTPFSPGSVASHYSKLVGDGIMTREPEARIGSPGDPGHRPLCWRYSLTEKGEKARAALLAHEDPADWPSGELPETITEEI